MKKITVRIDDETHSRIAALSQENRVPLNTLIVHLLAAGAGQSRPLPGAEMQQQVAEIYEILKGVEERRLAKEARDAAKAAAAA